MYSCSDHLFLCLHFKHLFRYATFSDQTLSEGTKFCSCTPACLKSQSLYFSVNQKNMQRWQLASVTRPIQTTSTLTQLITRTEEPSVSSLVQYQARPNATICTISFSPVIIHDHADTHTQAYRYNKTWWKIKSYLSGSQVCVLAHTWVCLCIFAECRKFSHNSHVLYKCAAGD